MLRQILSFNNPIPYLNWRNAYIQKFWHFELWPSEIRRVTIAVVIITDGYSLYFICGSKLKGHFQ